MDSNDSRLVRELLENSGDDAFRQLVLRYQDMVFSAALRRMGDSSRAEEVAQDVFVFFSQKARDLVAHPNLADAGVMVWNE